MEKKIVCSLEKDVKYPRKCEEARQHIFKRIIKLIEEW